MIVEDEVPYPNEHSARVRDPGGFEADSFRRKEIAPGISMVIGRLNGSTSMTAQAYRFARSKFTPEEARAWLKEHDVKYISFEEASNEEMDRWIRKAAGR